MFFSKLFLKSLASNLKKKNFKNQSSFLKLILAIKIASRCHFDVNN